MTEYTFKNVSTTVFFNLFTLYTMSILYIYHVPKCMSCHKAIVVITGRAHCFHDYIYITPILLLWDLSTLCVVDQLWPLILHIIYTIIYTYIKKNKGVYAFQFTCSRMLLIRKDKYWVRWHKNWSYLALFF